MIFNDYVEGVTWFRNYQELDESKKVNSVYSYHFKDLKFGDWFLFQEIIDNKKISRPILAIFTGLSIWDQAVVVNFVESKRAWMNFHRLYTDSSKNYTEYFIEHDPVIDFVQCWTSDIHLLGHWESRPDLSDLRIALGNKI